jgi:iron complex transport system permease protein
LASASEGEEDGSEHILSSRRDDFLDRFLSERRFRWEITLVISVSILFVLIVISSSIGYVYLAPIEVLSLLLQQVPFASQHGQVYSTVTSVDKTIFFQIRLPRILGAIIVGSALAASGTVLQDIFSNPLADPFITGVSSGAAFGAALSIVLGLGSGIFGLNSIIAVAFVCGVLSGGVSFLAAGKRSNSAMFLLAGVTVTFLNSAGVAFLTVLSGVHLPGLVFWLMGGLGEISWAVLLPTFPMIAIGLVGMLFFARDLNTLLFGEEQARSLGVNTERVKLILVALTTLVTSTAVSISGIIGFVGLIIPHVMRLMVGSDHRILLPSSIFVGASFLLLSDTVARTIMPPIDIPVGVVTAAVGGPFFIYLLRRQRRSITS